MPFRKYEDGASWVFVQYMNGKRKSPGVRAVSRHIYALLAYLVGWENEQWSIDCKRS
jgi:hypothetical protein